MPHRRWEVWRTTSRGGVVRHGAYRWRWVAAFVAWERTKAGWFNYEVKELGHERPDA